MLSTSPSFQKSKKKSTLINDWENIVEESK